MTTSSSLKKTVLYSTHVALKAKMEEFGGFIMPIQYEGIIKEHKAARESATLFDTCHMGKLRVTGDSACADLEKILSSNISTIKVGQSRYGFICNEQGGTIDDEITFRIADNKFIVVVNASTQHNDFNWMQQHLSKSTSITNISDITGKIDLQGPRSVSILNKLIDEPITELKYFNFTYRYYKNTRLLISRTGYTGEIGFEIFCPHDIAAHLWYDCMNFGASPAGLGCRDTLRLEMGYPLYGHELGENRSPAQTHYEKSIAKDKQFIGCDKVLDPANNKERLVGLVLTDRRAARQGDEVLSQNLEKIGTVTSGSYSPSLEKAIAFAYIDKTHSAPGSAVIISTQRTKMSATITDVPFYRNATGRKPMSEFLSL